MIPTPGTPDGYRNRDPRRDHYEYSKQKKPLQQQTSRKSSELQ
jgi:hypothetical protein